MPSVEENLVALTNRSLRTIRTELEFLTDSSVITPQQLSSILSQLPNQTPLHAPLHDAPTPATTALPTPSPQPIPLAQPPTNQMENMHMNEKQNGYFGSASPVPAGPPPPAYGASPAPAGPPSLGVCEALYAYNPTDAGDLAVMPNDRITVIEHMNADWWRGRNERTKQEGIFPRSYVKVLEEGQGMPPPGPPPSNYGNMPLDVSQGSSSAPGAPGEPQKESKVQQQGKKFGKKMGNAAIFGAGATIGSNIVNSIF
ncbi:MAG: hypothetical protein M1834_007751 [Cirrosporium novae-zelandiae]|nr:MAG: hypothetical protein M1834_007751 [Cirrosporium novae-zelandiae]